MTSTRRDLTLIERMVMKTIRALTEASEGYFAAFDEEMIRSWGVRGFLKACAIMAKHWARIEKQFGVENAHMVAFYSSMWNGCTYCGYGHLYAHNLNYFQRTGQLFPMREDEIEVRMRATDEEILSWVRTHLSGPEFGDKLRLIQRLYAVRMGSLEPGDAAEDEVLRLSIPFYSFINECSIVVESLAPPIGRIAKQKALIERYQEARAAAAAGTPADPNNAQT
ncbi:MAG: hypothetical protein JNJ46_08240 [Myxococcales bacterium]|nr:hypothetical protein [Myxococcales bacterium]